MIDNIPVVILCGGSGTRLREETEFTPKPMIRIGGKPMVWHIMKLYYHFGFQKFILALGYKQEAFKQYFAHYFIYNNDFTVSENSMINHHWSDEDSPRWEVTLVDTGEDTPKYERLRMVKKYICSDDFMMTYGDGIGDVNILDLWNYHVNHGRIATITGIHPTPRFGEMKISGSGRQVESFSEKPKGNDVIVNGGFFVFNRKVFEYLDDCGRGDLEGCVLPKLTDTANLMVYKHKGFWGCMDTIKEMHELDDMWKTGQAKWKIWK